MKAMILAAGLGTRLKPWTLEHPKALVPVGGVPMLERVILRLKEEGFDRIVVNVHHFANQIVDFLKSTEYGVKISVSDESGLLRDTGGGIVHAGHFLMEDAEPFLVHNVDILSDAPLKELLNRQSCSSGDATLLVSNRNSSRRLLFDEDMKLQGWKNLSDGKLRLKTADSEDAKWTDYAFSGIYAMSPKAISEMRRCGEVFPVMDYFLNAESKIEGFAVDSLNLIDIGKPETLAQANLSIGV